MDRLSKVADYIPVKTTYSGDRLAELYMKKIICLHRVPKKIVSDRGSQFTSRFWQKGNFGHQLEFQYSLPSIDRWTDWTGESNS